MINYNYDPKPRRYKAKPPRTLSAEEQATLDRWHARIREHLRKLREQYGS